MNERITVEQALELHLRAVVDRWTHEYHCCPESKAHRGHSDDCPLAKAQKFLENLSRD